MMGTFRPNSLLGIMLLTILISRSFQSLNIISKPNQTQKLAKEAPKFSKLTIFDNDRPSCSNNCIDCKNQGQCLRCKSGYELLNNKCEIKVNFIYLYAVFAILACLLFLAVIASVVVVILRKKSKKSNDPNLYTSIIDENNNQSSSPIKQKYLIRNQNSKKGNYLSQNSPRAKNLSLEEIESLEEDARTRNRTLTTDFNQITPEEPSFFKITSSDILNLARDREDDLIP